MVELGRGTGRGREAQVATRERLLAPAELREQFRLTPLGARVGRFRVKSRRAEGVLWVAHQAATY